MSARGHILSVAIFAVAVACQPRTDSSPRPNSQLITRVEIEETGARNLYEVVERLRPRWLVMRGPRSLANSQTLIVVFQDNMLIGREPNVLRNMGPDGVYSMRYVDGALAQATLPGIGNDHVEGAIIVSMRPPDAR